jgi:hypothetical protein
LTVAYDPFSLSTRLSVGPDQGKRGISMEHPVDTLLAFSGRGVVIEVHGPHVE